VNWKIIWQSLSHHEMRKRIFAVLGILVVFRVLAHIPVPLGDPETLRQVLQNLFTAEDTPQLLNVVNILSGGALANFSIMIAGLGPYINASIIMQLLRRAVPKFEAMQKEGEYGQKKLNQYTRMLTLPLAILQSIGAIYLIRQTAMSIGGMGDITADATMMQWVLMVAALTGGSMLLMWMGEQITERSVGNGISLLITVGIISQLPSFITRLWNSLFDGSTWVVFGKELSVNPDTLGLIGILIASVLVVTWLVVKINEAARRITVNYAKRVQGNRTYGGVTTVLPIKLIAAGVIPIIFAVAFLSVPSFVGQLFTTSASARLQEWGERLTTWFEPPSAATFANGDWQVWIYPVVYFLFVFLFTYFYTSITFNSKDIAENLQKQGGFIEGVRSGAQTEKYLSRTLNRLTLFGAIALGSLAVLPIIGQAFLETDIVIGGTSILILVSVSLETLRALESRALMVTYDQYAEPNFFQTAEEEDIESPKKRRFSLLPHRFNKKD
jgi:preprotein translocase subunit SecY